EVLVSVLLLSVSVLGLVRVLGASLQDSGDLQYRSEGAAIADDIIGPRWVDRANGAADETGCNEAEDWEDLPRLPGGGRWVCVSGDVARVRIRWQAPGSPAASLHEVSATLMSNDGATPASPPASET